MRGYPRGKLERDILVRVSPSIASGLGDDTFGVGLFHPLFDGKDETVQPGLVFNSLEFGGIKIRIVHLLPYAQKLGGFSSGTLSTNLILLVVYLVAGIFGLFLGDLAFGDKRRQKEKAEQEEAEEMLLEAKRREKEELENMTSSSKKSERKAPYRQERKPARKPSPAPQKIETADDDDFDYDKYLSGIDRTQDPNESEIDDILNEYRH